LVGGGGGGDPADPLTRRIGFCGAGKRCSAVPLPFIDISAVARLAGLRRIRCTHPPPHRAQQTTLVLSIGLHTLFLRQIVDAGKIVIYAEYTEHTRSPRARQQYPARVWVGVVVGG